MANIKDIALSAGVSISTVSNALNGKNNISKATKDKIIKICEEMSYSPGSKSKAFRAQDNNTVLFNFSDFDRSFFLRIINGVNDYLNDNGFNLMICTNKSCEKYMRSDLTRGCIILDERMKNDVLNVTASEDYPIVVLDRMIDNPHIKSIVVDNYESMYALMQGVVNAGYRKFGFVGGLEHTDDNKERYQAFIDVLEKNNIDFHRKNYFTGDYKEKSGYRVAKIFMLSKEMPEVLVCANDNMAIGAIKAFRENGLRVPEDIAVTGFDNCDSAEAIGLTTVSIPNYERGYLAARCLVEIISGKRATESLKISASVKWRKSVLVK